jgi:hypothetical protein
VNLLISSSIEILTSVILNLIMSTKNAHLCCVVAEDRLQRKACSDLWCERDQGEADEA